MASFRPVIQEIAAGTSEEHSRGKEDAVRTSTTIARTGSVEVPAPDDCRSKDGSRGADLPIVVKYSRERINPCLSRPQKSEHRLYRRFFSNIYPTNSILAFFIF